VRSDLGHPAHPPVSVVMTVLNESRHLSGAVRSVFDQDYPGSIELVVAVGPARDGTPDLARELAEAHPGMSVVDNPSGRTPSGLNLAIAAADPASTVIVRTDGHAQLPRDYLRTAVETLERTGAANVGGMMVPRGETAFEQAVARAMSSRIGLGSAPFHTGGTEGPADSVYLGAFDRTILDKAKGDEQYTRAQDWERIRTVTSARWSGSTRDCGLTTAHAAASLRWRPSSARPASGVPSWSASSRRRRTPATSPRRWPPPGWPARPSPCSSTLSPCTAGS
jgi:hypothetical protein